MKRLIVLAAALLSSVLFAQNPPPQQQPDNDPPFVKQARQLMHDGKLDEALGIFENELKSSPDSQDALLGAGVVLDLELKGADARKYFQKAIDGAKDDEQRADANRAMAMSWAFESNCQMSGAYEQKVLDYAKAKNDFFRAGEIADEAGRVCMDSNDVERAMLWYEEGHKLGLKEPNIKPERKDLWDFRLENAEARAASHLTDDDDPMKHIAAAKGILDRGTNPQQAQFLPSLQGYVAFYTSDYKAALAFLQQANQNDPFIQCLLAMTYEKLGDNEHAMEFYKKAATATNHNPAAAFAVPKAKKKIAAK